MFKLKVLCTGFMLSSTAALLGMSFGRTPNDFEKMIEDIAKNGCSESVQRTVDGCIRVALSEKNKKRNEHFIEEFNQLLVNNIGDFMSDVMNEITPEDAQELLPFFDSMTLLIKQCIEYLPNMENMSREERASTEMLLNMSVMSTMLQIVKYVPGLEKHKDLLKNHKQDAGDEIIRSISNDLDKKARDLRAIIVQKVRS